MNRRQFLKILFVGTALTAGLAVWIDHTIEREAAPFLFDSASDVRTAEVALVLGARVYSSGGVSTILEDRLIIALDLYRSGKVGRFLLSGDHGTLNYDEVNTMRRYLLSQGVRSSEIFLDHAGFDTYDSMTRARDVFKARSLVIVTQGFHLPRAVWIARQKGLDATGLSSDRHQYAAAGWYRLREIAARVKCYFDVWRNRPPRFGGPPIPLDGDSRASWDEK